MQLILLDTPDAAEKKKGRECAGRMLRVLRKSGNVNGGWLKRKDLYAHGLTDRQCRLGRQYSKARIIFSSRGYKATRLATMDEIDSCANRIKSQIEAMQMELTDLWRFKHGAEKKQKGGARKSKSCQIEETQQ